MTGKSLESPVQLGAIGNSSDIIQIDTVSSEAGDTEIGVFNSVGELIDHNDDSNITGSPFQAALILDPTLISDGTYYIIAGIWNTHYYGNNFSVEGKSCEHACGLTVNIRVNGVQITSGVVDFVAGEIVLYYLTFTVGAIVPPATTQNCFRKDSLVQTDQELIKIQNIIANYHTINNKPVKAITSAFNIDGVLVKIEKECLGKDLPASTTFMQKDHKLLISLFEFASLLTSGKISFVESDPKEILYNVLLDNQEIMLVNGVSVETQNPELEISKYHMNPSEDFKNKIEAQTQRVPVV